MKRRLFMVLICVVLMSFGFELSAQEGTHSLTRENISMVVPNDWLAIRTGKKFGDFGLKIQKQNSVAFVEVNCIRRKTDPVSKATTLASERSNKETFAYMQIDAVQDAKLDKKNAKHLVYTNAYLTDTYRGGIYALVDNGYTYTIEYYGADTPAGRKEIEQILSSIKIEKPLAQDNIVKIEQDFVPSDWKEAPIEQTEQPTEENVSAKEKKSKSEKVNLTKEEKKQLKEQKKRLKEETKKVEKKKKELEKKKKELDKKQKQEQKEKQKAEQRRKKAMKAKKDDSELKELLEQNNQQNK